MRNPAPEDELALAALMDSAYRGTIDYRGETLNQAVEEIRGWFREGPLVAASWVAERDGGLQSGSLLSQIDDHVLIAYVMTAAPFKGRGLARLMVLQSLRSLRGRTSEVRAWITEGNVPSERLFVGLGFARV